MKPSHALVAAVQMCSSHGIDSNIQLACKLIKEAHAQGAALVSLPENCLLMPLLAGDQAKAADSLNGSLLLPFRCLAKTLGIFISLGGIAEKSPHPEKPYNTHVIINDAGEIAASYRKIHLFSIAAAEKAQFDEGQHTSPGDKLVLSSSPIGQLGLSICFDLRFPAMYIDMAKKGAEVMLTPAAFTAYTGKAHWELLLRARAIDSQSYVVAAAQWGKHSNNRHTHGHAMIVNPWGEIMAECHEENSFALAAIDLDYLHQIRTQMPLLALS